MHCAPRGLLTGSRRADSGRCGFDASASATSDKRLNGGFGCRSDRTERFSLFDLTAANGRITGQLFANECFTGPCSDLFVAGTSASARTPCALRVATDLVTVVIGL